MSQTVYLDQTALLSGLRPKSGTRIGLSVRSPSFGDSDLLSRAVVLCLSLRRSSLELMGGDRMNRLVYLDDIRIPTKSEATEDILREILNQINSLEVSSAYNENAVVLIRFKSGETCRFECAPGPVLGPVPRDFFEFPDEIKESLTRSVTSVLSPGGGFVIFG